MTYTIKQIVDAMMLIEAANEQFCRGQRGNDIPDMMANAANEISPVVYAAYVARVYGNSATTGFYLNRECEPGYSMVNQ